MTSENDSKIEIVEEAVMICLSQIEQFEEDKDYIAILDYAGPDECYLEGSKNGLRLFALDILRKSCDLTSESGILGCFDPQSKVGIESIKLVGSHTDLVSEHSWLKEKMITFALKLFLILIMSSTLIGFMTIYKWLAR